MALSKSIKRYFASGPFFGSGAKSSGSVSSGAGVIYEGAVLVRKEDGTLGLPQNNLAVKDYVGVALKEFDATATAGVIEFQPGYVMLPKGALVTTDLGAEVAFTADNTVITVQANVSGCYARRDEGSVAEVALGAKFG